jgi:putative ABC transport system permease protein
LGYARNNLLTAYLQLPKRSYPKPADWTRFWQRLGLREASLPGVKGVAFSQEDPDGDGPVTIGGTDAASSRMTSPAGEQPASADYFRVMGVPLLRGREFDDRDRKNSRPVAIVNEAFAAKFFPHGDPIGKVIKLGKPDSKKPWLTIIGVVGNVKHTRLALGYGGGPCIYQPLPQDPKRMLSMFVRTAANPQSFEKSIARAFTAVAPELPAPEIDTQNQWLAQWNAQPRFRAALFGVFGALAMLLAAVGIYGVLSLLVGQRTHEIGIRMALGARQRDVLRMIVGEGLQLIAFGAAIGIAGALGLTRLLSSLLYGIRPDDPLTFIAVSIVLSGVALLACYVPARRAAKVEPVEALRYE